MSHDSDSHDHPAPAGDHHGHGGHYAGLERMFDPDYEITKKDGKKKKPWQYLYNSSNRKHNKAIREVKEDTAGLSHTEADKEIAKYIAMYDNGKKFDDLDEDDKAFYVGHARDHIERMAQASNGKLTKDSIYNDIRVKGITSIIESYRNNKVAEHESKRKKGYLSTIDFRDPHIVDSLYQELLQVKPETMASIPEEKAKADMEGLVGDILNTHYEQSKDLYLKKRNAHGHDKGHGAGGAPAHH